MSYRSSFITKLLGHIRAIHSRFKIPAKKLVQDSHRLNRKSHSNHEIDTFNEQNIIHRNIINRLDAHRSANPKINLPKAEGRAGIATSVLIFNGISGLQS